MKLVNIVLGTLGASLALTACNSSVDFKKTPAGVPYKVYSGKKGDSAHMNYVVQYHVTQKINDTGLLFSTWGEGNAIFEMIKPVEGQIAYTDIRSNVMSVLPRVKAGDSIYLVQAADSFLKQNPEQKELKKGDRIATTIHIINVYRTGDEAQAAYMKQNEPKRKKALAEAEQQDQQNLQGFRNDTAAQRIMSADNRQIESYLAKKGIQATKTPWGVYIHITDPGQGPKPTTGQFVNVQYKGMHMSGESFDQGVFPMQVGTQGSIKGFEEGVRQLAKGGKATIYIPSMLGYGRTGSGDKIKPNENLIFDLEVLDISDTPPARQGQQ